MDSTPSLNGSNPQVLAFGIPSLDVLLGSGSRNSNHEPQCEAEGTPIESAEQNTHNPIPPASEAPHGYSLGNLEEAISICIIGPDGTGKSVLAMHLASHYSACVANEQTRIMFVSTDLSYESALKPWGNFLLDYPALRREHLPFREGQFQKINLAPIRFGGHIKLEDYTPFNLVNYLCWAGKADADTREVAFIDLESKTSGDDWGFLNRVLATMDEPKEGEPRHLLVIDAVEGLEILVGHKDAFGQERERRSRIAQLMRSANKKCHIVLVVEEATTNERMPEEFVTDIVVRLRTTVQRDYSRRTVELEKVRGQSHIRGKHDFTIRDGTGARTDKFEHPDDPKIHVDVPIERESRFLSYIHVLHSIHSLNRAIMRESTPQKSADDVSAYAGFGIQYLDEMLAGSRSSRRQNKDNSEPPKPQIDPCGLIAQSVTALIGDDGTQKGRLGRAFLAQSFSTDHREAGFQTKDIAILLTYKAITEEHIKRSFEKILPPTAYKNLNINRVFYRRLPIHYASSSLLLHVVQSLVHKAQAQIFGGKVPDAAEERFVAGKYIRLVIEDWSTLRSAYPEVSDDPLFLPSLCFYLRREGINTLIIDSHYGSPSHILAEEKDRELRSLVDHHLYTWHVPFFGERRVAITALPPLADDHPSRVRELAPDYDIYVDGRRGMAARTSRQNEDVEALLVDPHFELYMGLEEGNPQSVPLLIRLFSPPAQSQHYLEQTNRLMEQLYRGVDDKPIITAEDESGYKLLQDFSYLQNDTFYNSTLVFQVDEFWAESRSKMSEQERYLWAETYRTDRKFGVTSIEDPFEVFQPSQDQQSADVYLRKDFFSTVGYDMDEYFIADDIPMRIDKVPYTWDFGLLLCRQKAWEMAHDKPLKPREDSQEHRPLTVGEVWKRLNCPMENTETEVRVSWREFFEACRLVAEMFDACRQFAGTEEKIQHSTYVFDLDLTAIESFSSLVLEIWASEIKAKHSIKDVFCSKRHEKYGMSLPDLVTHYKQELYRTWLLLKEVLTPSQFSAKGHYMQTRCVHKATATARHWYSTACTVDNNPDDPWVPLGLPGSYSVRGDWFLAVAKSSRSLRLGDRALDLLCSRRGNIMRIQEGIGLPVRNLYPMHSVDKIEVAQGEASTDETINGLASAYSEFWTPLFYTEESSHQTKSVKYRKLRTLGAWEEKEQLGRKDQEWLWRSTIPYYDRHSRIWQKWLCQLMNEWDGMVQNQETGFEKYDRGVNVEDDQEFSRFCYALHRTLLRATNQEINPVEEQGSVS